MTFFLKLTIIIYIIFNIYLNYVHAIVYSLSDKNELVGKNKNFIIPKNNIHSLEYFAEKFQIGLRNILEANPNTDLYLPSSETELIIPTQLILPNTSHTGIIINSAETRLYYYPNNNKNIVIVFPISIGTIYHETPLKWITSIKYKKKIQFGFLLKICVMHL